MAAASREGVNRGLPSPAGVSRSLDDKGHDEGMAGVLKGPAGVGGQRQMPGGVSKGCQVFQRVGRCLADVAGRGRGYWDSEGVGRCQGADAGVARVLKWLGGVKKGQQVTAVIYNHLQVKG